MTQPTSESYPNSDRFLTSFAKIERALREQVGGDRSDSFVSLVNRARARDPAVRTHEVDLREFADLRNALVHERSDGRPIAEPFEATVTRLEQIEASITRPPKAAAHAASPVATCEPTAMIGETARSMVDEGFSQLPVVSDGTIQDVLTTETIARWMAHQMDAEGGILIDQTVAEVLAWKEEDSEWKLVSRDATVFDVLAHFGDAVQRGKNLRAVILTHTGRATESPLGIVTIADLPIIVNSTGARLPGLN